MEENKEKNTEKNKKNFKNAFDPKKFKKNIGGPEGGDNKPKMNIYWIYGIIAAVFLSILLFDNSIGGPRTIPAYQAMEYIKDGEVENITIINRIEAEITIRPESVEIHNSENGGKVQPGSKGPHYRFEIGNEEGFSKELEEAQKDLAPEKKVKKAYQMRESVFEKYSTLFIIILMIAVWVFIMRRMTGGAGGGQIFNVGKSKATLFDKNSNVKIDFKDVAGLEEAKIEIKEIVDFLKNSKKYTELGAKIPKGALLVGPPGTGKTLLAKAVAGEAQVPFFSMSGSDFVEMFVGVGASRVRDLFRQAKEKSPCIVFIDEIDAIGRARGKNPMQGANDERENTLNQLLTEMDGFGTNSGVIILAATNRADILDRALMRAGRFDRQIHVELPDLPERIDIFKVHMKPIKVDKSVDIDLLGKQTPGFSGADIANVCNEAALIAARKGRLKIGKQDFLDAVDRIIGGLEKRNKIISKGEKKVIAYHEAGHATLSWLLEHAHPLIKVTIIPRGKALGAAWYLPEERQITTVDQMKDEMCALLGGRASEEVFFGQVSTGALNDIERASKQAYSMVAIYGLNEKIGNVSYYDSSGQNEYSFNKPYSESTAKVIDEEVKGLVEEQYQRAIDIINENKERLEKLGDLLLEKEVIFSDDLEDIFGKRKWMKVEDELGIKKSDLVSEDAEVVSEKEDKKDSVADNSNLESTEDGSSDKDDNEPSSEPTKES